MSQFLRGWRKKIVCATLVMSLVSMAGWIRSEVIANINHVKTHPTKTLVFASHCGGLVWGTIDGNPAITRFEARNPISTISQNITAFRDNSILGFRSLKGITNGDNSKVAIWIIPYWSMAIQLSRFSAYLLLNNQSNSRHKKLAEPIAP